MTDSGLFTSTGWVRTLLSGGLGPGGRKVVPVLGGGVERGWEERKKTKGGNEHDQGRGGQG